jgi:hypothetical protein
MAFLRRTESSSPSVVRTRNKDSRKFKLTVTVRNVNCHYEAELSADISDAFTITTPIVVVVNYDKMLDSIVKALSTSLRLTEDEINDIDRKLRQEVPAKFTMNEEASSES